MFENLSIVTKILLGITVVGVAASAVSVIKDCRADSECDCACECEECTCEELVDPAAELI